MAIAKSDFVVTWFLIRRRFRIYRRQARLRQWYNNRDALEGEQKESYRVLFFGLLFAMLCISIGVWPYVIFVKYGQFMFGY